MATTVIHVPLVTVYTQIIYLNILFVNETFHIRQIDPPGIALGGSTKGDMEVEEEREKAIIRLPRCS